MTASDAAAPVQAWLSTLALSAPTKAWTWGLCAALNEHVPMSEAR